MKTKSLEEEIIETTTRTTERISSLESQIFKLESKIKCYTNWSWIFVGVGFVMLLLGVIYYIHKMPSDFGLNLLGDFLSGAVASIWSLAGLFFIYVAFLGQKQQLLYQQQEIMYSQLELKYTRFELEGQKQEMIEQNYTLKQQRFENTFFQLLRNHQDIVNGIDIRVKESNSKTWTVSQQGRDCFKIFHERFFVSITNNTSYENTRKAYMNFYNVHQSDLGHYFRNLYHILKYINRATEIEKHDKFKYTSLLRALLSSYELVFLFYNCLGEYGYDYFKPLVEEYSFLKNLDRDLIRNEELFSKYDDLAFASSKERDVILKKRKILENYY